MTDPTAFSSPAPLASEPAPTLPPVYGIHNDYWLWGPPPADEESVVMVIDIDAEELEKVFDSVVVGGVTETPWAQESRMTILVCRGLQRPIGEIWENVKLFI